MFLLDGTVVTSASDLTTASKCEFAFLRRLDAKLGRLPELDVAVDPMLKRAGELGGEHEQRQLEVYRAAGGVAEIAMPRPLNRETLQAAAEATLEAFRSEAAVVYQATFFDESDPDAPFIGFADFIVRQPDGRYLVQDTKLARSVKVTALLQLAAYYQQLVRLGIPADDTVELLLGDGTVAAYAVGEILPVYLNRRARILTITAERLADTTAVEWADPRYTIDGHCDHCEVEVERTRDLLLVAGIRVTQRAKLIAAGVDTIDQLAHTPVKPPDCALSDRTYSQLQAQAALQAQVVPGADPHDAPPFVLYAPGVIADLPEPDDGDIFFDFEGDPLHFERDQWGLDYLFGLVDVDETFTAFWAHDLEEEKQALVDFLDFVVERRERHPGMHIYHYASYERTHLQTIAGRHGVGEHIVDLYSTVRKCLRVGGSSYSIKKLEPLYMGDEQRTETGVATAIGSVEEYVRSREELASGNEDEAQRILDEIASYNEYDCRSTVRLRDWLLARAAEQGVLPGTAAAVEIDDEPFEPSELNLELVRRAETADDETDARAYALAAAAIDYHRRENKSFWWEHFARLTEPMAEWAETTRGVFDIESVEVLADWNKSGRQRVFRRLLRATGTWAPGSGSPRDKKAFLLYAQPTPFVKPRRRPGSLLDHKVTITDEPETGSVVIEETCPGKEELWQQSPVAIAPDSPPDAKSVIVAIQEWGEGVVAGDDWPRDSASDILTRRAPRARSGALEPSAGADDTVRAVIATVLDLDDSYLAVQGPPGTGKTYLAAHVITTLVRDHGWKVGVVGQSHKVVENVLSSTVKAGLDASRVGKAPRTGETGAYEGELFTELPENGHAAFAGAHPDGYVMGGTQWDFTNLNRFDRGQLDLLVIDEAGQFALAPTIGVSVVARNLLLLGDPQQLPQVTQGTHPAPVDQSALGYIAGGHPVLPPELGYFLADSRRMHPEVTAPVSHLAYDDALRSHPRTLDRMLAGIDPGLHTIAVPHHDNATESPEEADRVVALVQELLGRQWTNPDEARVADALQQEDIIVVTPYNAQLELVRERLDAAGLTAVPAGTVDKFQGQEAVVSIVSLAASSPADVPRGLSFLLSRNRLNVAISRAQWAAFLLYSPELIEFLPGTPDAVAELSRFIELVAAE